VFLLTLVKDKGCFQVIFASTKKVGFEVDFLYVEFFILQDSITLQKKHLSHLNKQMLALVDNFNLSKTAINKLVKIERDELKRNNKNYAGYSNSNLILSIIKQPTRSARLPKVDVPPKRKIAFKILHKSRSSKSTKTFNVSTEITRFYFENRIAHFRLVDIMRSSGLKVTHHFIPAIELYIENVNYLNLRYQEIYDNYIKTEFDYKMIADYLNRQDEDIDDGS
jgi:hypothetical protein